jgi:two-component system LytT family response regulator
MNQKIKCITIDDDEKSRERMEMLLSMIPETVLSYQSNFHFQIFDIICQIQPHLIFLEIELYQQDGFEIIKELKRRNLKSKIVFTTTHSHYSIKALKYGAFDYLQKPIDIDELKNTINRFSHSVFSSPVNKENGNITFDFSQREKEIVNLLVKGKTSQEIGVSLGITKNTVDTHRRKILEKTGLGSTLELIAKLKQL